MPVNLGISLFLASTAFKDRKEIAINRKIQAFNEKEESKGPELVVEGQETYVVEKVIPQKERAEVHNLLTFR